MYPYIFSKKKKDSESFTQSFFRYQTYKNFAITCQRRDGEIMASTRARLFFSNRRKLIA